MSIHGRHVPSSYIADDRFEARCDRGDDDPYLAHDAAAESDERAAEDDPAPVAPARTRRSFTVPPLDVYLPTVLDAWQNRWGQLSAQQRWRFLQHHAVWELTTYPEVIVLRAVRRVRKLDQALALVRDWAQGDTRLDIEPDDVVEEPEGGEEDADVEIVGRASTGDTDVSYEAAVDVLEDICPDLLEAEGAEDVLLHAAMGCISVVETCRELNALIAHHSSVGDAYVEQERVRQAVKRVRQSLGPYLELILAKYQNDW